MLGLSASQTSKSANLPTFKFSILSPILTVLAPPTVPRLNASFKNSVYLIRDVVHVDEPVVMESAGGLKE
jgi:hypothetical protein